MGLKAKITLVVVGMLAVLLAVATVIDLTIEERGVQDLAYEQLEVLSSSVLKSLLHDMIDGDSDGIQHILKTVATEEKIKNISIFTEDGIVVKSSDGGNIGHPVAADLLDAYKGGVNRLTTHKEGFDVLRTIKPIANGPSCYGCHDKSIEIISIMSVEYSLEGIELVAAGHRRVMFLVYLAALSFGAACMVYMLDRLVVRPVGRLKDAMDRARDGDPGPQVPAGSGDEVGDLTDGFGVMLRRINELHEETVAQQKAIVLKEQEVRMMEALATKNEALKQLNRDASDINRRYMEMLDFLSDDVRSPFTLVKGYLNMLSEGELGELSEEQKSAVGAMDRSLESLQGILANYASLSDIEKGLIIPEKREADLIEDVVRPVMHRYAAELEKAGMGMKVDCPPGPVYLWMDTSLMSAALGNMVAGLIKFGRPETDIEVVIAVEGNEVVLGMANAGMDITGPEAEKLFGRSEVDGESEDTAGSASGLGLYIVRQIVGLHGGTVRVKSSEGAWSGIVCRLPFGSGEE